MKLEDYGNYRIFLFSNSLMAFASGLFGPFYIIFLQNFGGSIQQFGFSIGLMALFQSVTSYFAGKYSDKIGRKIFLLLGGFLSAAIIFLYTLITSIMQLYILQVALGITGAMTGTMTAVFLADVTKKVSRGTDIGKYRAIVGIISALSIMGGGYVVGQLGYKAIFYFTAAVTAVSTLLLFYIREKSSFN